MAVFSEFAAQFAISWPPAAWHDVRVVLAVSGGADSVAMCRAMAGMQAGEAGGLIVGHLNHGLRGAASDADQRFVEELAGELGLPCYGQRWLPASPTEEQLFASEESARAARYAFLEQLACDQGARYVATAHTLDDQAETVLHRIIRGTGLEGLRGMRRARPLSIGVSLIRPMLSIRRAAVLGYLAAIGQPFCTDLTNDQTRYTRNRIRHELLPMLADRFNPRVREGLVRLGELAGEACDVIQPLIDQLAEAAIVRREADCVVLDCDRLAGEPAYLRRELLIAVWNQQGWPRGGMSFAAWQELAALTEARVTAHEIVLPGGIRAKKQRGQVLLAPAAVG